MPQATLSGVIAAVATPVARTARPTSRAPPSSRAILLDNGCDGLNVLGTTGEATSFSLEERKRVMSGYRDAGLPLDRLMVGTGAAAIADAVALTRHAAELGFAGALVLPPFYYKGVPDDGLVAYVETIVQATAQKPIPIYLYHFPQQSGLHWHVALVRRLLDKFGQRIVGLKDSSGDMAYAREAAAISQELRRVPLDRSRADRGARRRVRRLHLGHRQPQRRSLPARLEQGRPGRARRRCHHPQAVRRQAARSPASRRCSRTSTPIRRWRGSSRRSRRSRPPTAPA